MNTKRRQRHLLCFVIVVGGHKNYIPPTISCKLTNLVINNQLPLFNTFYVPKMMTLFKLKICILLLLFRYNFIPYGLQKTYNTTFSLLSINQLQPNFSFRFPFARFRLAFLYFSLHFEKYIQKHCLFYQCHIRS